MLLEDMGNEAQDTQLDFFDALSGQAERVNTQSRLKRRTRSLAKDGGMLTPSTVQHAARVRACEALALPMLVGTTNASNDPSARVGSLADDRKSTNTSSSQINEAGNTEVGLSDRPDGQRDVRMDLARREGLAGLVVNTSADNDSRRPVDRTGGEDAIEDGITAHSRAPPPLPLPHGLATLRSVTRPDAASTRARREDGME